MVKLDDSLRSSLVSKLDEYQSIVQTSIDRCRAKDDYSDSYSRKIKSLKEPFLYALTILEGNREKYFFCLESALERSIHQSPSTCGTLYNAVDYAKLRAEIVTLATLLEQKDTEEYINEQMGMFDKAMKKAGLEIRDVEQDKLPRKQKK